MKHFKRLNLYKSNNCQFDPDKIKAISYDWWIFVKKINGLVIFNNYGYSNSTTKHQYNVKALLYKLGITIDHYIKSPNGLQDLNSSIDYYTYEINHLRDMINKPKSRKSTNLDRLAKINEYISKISVIKSLINSN